MSGTFVGFRLSPQQARLLALAQADADWPLFACALFEVEGGLESRDLKAAVETIVAQHEILRTKIVPEPSGEGLIQVVTDSPSYDFREVCAGRDVLLDGGPGEPSGGEGLAVWYIRQEGGPALLRLQAPALLCDGQGLRNLACALLHAYGNHRGEAEEPLQYADVAEVFCRLLESEDTRTGRDQWRGRWPADTLALRLPLEPPAPERDAGQPLAVVRRHLSPGLGIRLTTLAEGEGVSVESLVAACWLAVLRGLSGTPDLHVGVMVEGRDFEGLERSVGPFARCLPLRSTVRPETGFRDFVRGIERDLAMLRRFQDYFVPDPPSYLPLGFSFSSGFEIAAGGLSLRLRREQSIVDRFHLQLSILWDREAPEISLAYDGRIYGKDGVEALADDLVRALEICRPSAEVGELFPGPRLGVDEEALTTIGERVASLWSEVLGIAVASSRDDFFTLGGDSSLAARLVSRIQSVFQVELPVRALFEEPTVAGLARWIDLALALGEAAEPPIVPVDRSGPLPMSFAQQRLWFLNQLEPDSPAYNISRSTVLSGGLNLAALAASLGEIVRRHEALRTVFKGMDGEPRQVVRPAASFPLPLVDLSGLASSRAHAEAERVAAEEAARPFDLARGPLLRAAVLCLGDENAVLTTMHHIVSDGWSMGIFSSELRALYEAALAGHPSPLPELPVQYGDFAVWQRRWLSGSVLERKLGFWRQHLAGVPALLELPADRPRPPVQSWLRAVCSFRLPAALSQDLVRLGQSRKVTLFTVLLAAFQCLLCRWSGQRDLSVGTPIAGRTFLELEGLVGLFVNTLVLRGDLSGDPGFGALLERTWNSVLEAHAHQDVPFEKLVEELAPERSLAHSPFFQGMFQVMFALQNLPGRQGRKTLQGVRENGLLAGGVAATFDLTLAISESDEGLIGGLEYNTDLFDATTMARLQLHFETLLRGVVEDPGRALSSLPLLTDWERAQLLVEWNAGALDRLDSGPRVHELFAEQAARTPEAVALVFEGGSLSYADLHRRSDLWACRLERRGVRRGSIVGLCLARGPEMIEALFGILKAGAAYLPLDPSSPTERLESLLVDAGVEILVTTGRLCDSLAHAVSQVVDPYREAESLSAESQEALTLQADPESLAYVIYTSDSTGSPRGVLVKHGSLAAYSRVAAREFGLGPGDRVLQFASLAFDASAEEIFPCLICGATLVLRPDGMMESASRFLEASGELAVSVLGLPTAFWHELVAELETGGAALPASVRLVIIEGEQAFRERVASWRRTVGDRVRLLNTYGPTEATIIATSCDLSAGSERAPIGAAIPGVQAYVLDRSLRLVPVGAAGELCLGGAGLARGYLGRPELTAERFIPDPFGGLWGEPGARLYRTGDRVRWLPEGTLEYLGHLDHQVKVRGFRVELGEIETALLASGQVREAVVVFRDGETEDRRLVAYVVAPEAPGLCEDLQDLLRRKLPDYMVPSAIVRMASLPSPTGKVDRRALPAPEAAGPARRSGARTPHGNVEVRLIRLWGEILGTRSIGVQDDFFAIGGHSLLAVRLLASLRREFGRELPLSLLFEARTIEALAQRLREGWEPQGDPLLVPIWSSGTKPPFFCVHPIGGTVFCYAELSRALGVEQPFYGLQAPHPGAGASWGIEDLAAQYITAMRRIQPRGPYALGGWSMGGVVAFEMARQLAAHGEPVSLLALIESHAASAGGGASEETLADLFVRDMADLTGFRLEGLGGDGPERGEDDLLIRLLEAGQSQGAFPRDLSFAEVRDVFLVFKRNHEALQMYTVKPYSGRAELFLAQSSLDIQEDLSAQWSGLAEGGVEVYVLPGDHYSLLREPRVGNLAARLRVLLESGLTQPVGENR